MLYNKIMYRKVFINTYLKNGFSFDEAKSEVDFALETLFNFTYKDFMLGKVLESWQITKLEKDTKYNIAKKILECLWQKPAI